MRNNLYLVLLLSFLVQESFSQKGPEVGIYIGPSQYFGELNTTNSFLRPGYAAGLLYRYNFDDRISIKGALSHIYLKANDIYSTNAFERDRNANFRSRLWELAATMEFNFFTFMHGRDDYKFTPYLMGGGAFTQFNSTGVVNGNEVNLSGQIEDVNYSSYFPSAVLGMGFKYSLNHKWLLNIEAGYRFAFSDYIDDVSTVNANGLQRGNEFDNDRYVVLQIGILRYLGTLQCPDITKKQEIKRKKRKKRNKK